MRKGSTAELPLQSGLSWTAVTCRSTQRTIEGTDKLTLADKHNLANFVQATTAFHSLNALILRLL